MGFLTQPIFKFSKSAFGLDISDISVKVMMLENKGGNMFVSGFGMASVAPGNIVDGEIINDDQVVLAIKKAIEKSGPKKIDTKKVVCSLPETKAFLRIITVPIMADEELKEAIKWEIEANIPLTIDQVYYDWQPLEKSLGNEKNKINVLVVAVAKKVVDRTMETMAKIGLDVVGLEIESVAQTRSLLDENKENLTTLTVDIGDRRTSFTISVGNVPCFTSSIPLSGQVMTSTISTALSISFEEAEKMKIQYGIGSDFKNDALFKAQKPILENLVSEIERSIDFYISGLKYSSSIDQILLCGGGANSKGLIPYLSKRLGREVLLGNPWINIHMGKKLPPIEREQSTQYSTAIGLALKGMQYES